MNSVSIDELQRTADHVIERIVAGEHLVVTRHGVPMAELRPVRSAALPAHLLLERWRTVPSREDETSRADVDRLIDPSL